jgi:uncharacterized protein (TIGR00303 family)
MIETITGSKDFIESLRGKSATFILSMSNTKTANIEGITQAGIPGMLYLTPILDAEFIALGEVRSLPQMAQTPKGVPTPALITRAVHTLKPFGNLEFLDLGLEQQANINYFKTYEFNINPSDAIDADASINAIDLFEKGVAFGQEYEPKTDYVILGESVPSGTTTALATASMLGYDCEDLFSSSFKDDPKNIKNEVVKKALEHADLKEEFFEKLGTVSDNMIIFNAGFILGSIEKDYKLILAGGTQMAAVLLTVNSILKQMHGSIDSSKLALCTTNWVANDTNSDIKQLLEMLDFKVNAYCSKFDFSLANHPALKLYDEGEAKEGVGAGAALVYASLNGLTKEEITKQVESFLG